MSELISIRKLPTNVGTQSRVGLDQDVVREYAEQFTGMNAAWPFPPVVAFYDGQDYWLADGFHRLAAAHLYMEREKFVDHIIAVDVRQGERRDAILYSVGANAEHGLRRTNEDKRRAVTRLLTDNEWNAWSNREIARRCRVDESLVRRLRDEPSAVQPQIADTERTVTRNGVTYTQNTANIGKTTAVPTGPGQAARQTLPSQRNRTDEMLDDIDERLAEEAAGVGEPQPVRPNNSLIFCFHCGLRRDDPAQPCPRCAELSYIDHTAAAWAKTRRWEQEHNIPTGRPFIPPPNAADLLYTDDPAVASTIDRQSPNLPISQSPNLPPTDNVELSPDGRHQTTPIDIGTEWIRLQSLYGALSQMLGLLHQEHAQTAEDYGFGVELQRLIADARTLRAEIVHLTPNDRIT